MLMPQCIGQGFSTFGVYNMCELHCAFVEHYQLRSSLHFQFYFNPITSQAIGKYLYHSHLISSELEIPLLINYNYNLTLTIITYT